jgi:LPS-assembly lipoprotein
MSWPETGRRPGGAVAGRHRRALAAGAAVLLLAGCGFSLVRTPELAFRRLAFSGFAPRSTMADAVRRLLPAAVREVAPAEAEVVLLALAERRDRNVVVSTPFGQVRELQLAVALRFRAQTPAGRELVAETELRVVRDLSFDEKDALAKASEAEQLYAGMEDEVATLVLQRLAVIRI